jgi:hypothetical protein
MMEAVRTSKTLVNFYQTTRRNIPEDSHLQTLKNFFDRTMHYGNIRISFPDKQGPAGSNVGYFREENNCPAKELVMSQ